MTLSEALDIVVARTGVERYRILCHDDNPDIEQRDGYRAWVISQATGQPIVAPTYPYHPTATMPLAESFRLADLARACLFRSREGCGCGGYNCALAGRVVSGQDCFECVGRYGW